MKIKKRLNTPFILLSAILVSLPLASCSALTEAFTTPAEEVSQPQQSFYTVSKIITSDQSENAHTITSGEKSIDQVTFKAHDGVLLIDLGESHMLTRLTLSFSGTSDAHPIIYTSPDDRVYTVFSNLCCEGTTARAFRKNGVYARYIRIELSETMHCSEIVIEALEV